MRVNYHEFIHALCNIRITEEVVERKERPISQSPHSIPLCCTQMGEYLTFGESQSQQDQKNRV